LEDLFTLYLGKYSKYFYKVGLKAHCANGMLGVQGLELWFNTRGKFLVLLDGKRLPFKVKLADPHGPQKIQFKIDNLIKGAEDEQRKLLRI
jgi:predicted acetyltransferase